MEPLLRLDVKINEPIYHEFRSGTKRSGKLLMVQAKELEDLTGFQSVYGVTGDDRDQLLVDNSTRGLRSCKLYSNMLFLDIDDNDALVPTFQKTLQELDLSYYVYHTGNRGFHFHIPIQEMYGVDTAYKQRLFVEEYFEGADVSIYKTSGLIRLPGTFHTSKPGKRKTLITSYLGTTLNLQHYKITLPITLPREGDSENDSEKALDYLLMQTASAGGRNDTLYKIAFLCEKEGYTVEDTVQLIRQYNLSLVSPPVKDNEIIKVDNSAYGRF